MRTVFVVIHAAAGIGGLIAGLYALPPPRPADNRAWARGAYAVCIALLLASMVVLVAMDWSGLDAAARIAFGALIGLGAVMAFRLFRARHHASARGTNWQDRYIGHVYFTYISLWERFVILPALNLPLPQVTVPAVAIAVLLIGHLLISRYKSALGPATLTEKGP